MKIRITPLLCALLLAGCAEENVNWGNPTKVCEAPDGDCWEWNCESDGCLPGFTDEIDPAGFPDCADNEELYAAWLKGRFVEIYIFCTVLENDFPIYWSASASDGRMLICEGDSDCPRSKPHGLYECVGGLCQNEDTDLYSRDAVSQLDAQALCFAGFTRAETVSDPDLVMNVLADIDAACPGEWDTPCAGELPEYCWSAD